jgi:diaminopimelate decarboxylase
MPKNHTQNTQGLDHQWWTHDQLTTPSPINGAGLRNLPVDCFLGGRSIRDLARQNDTPFYAYSQARMEHKYQVLAAAATTVSARGAKIFYAMKANRNPHILATARGLGAGVDTCSGDEIKLALQSGFSPADISYTCVAMTGADLELLGRMPEISVNCDSISQIQALSRVSPGRSIGLRINPATGYGYNDALQYSSGERVTKFGIYASDFEDALKSATDLGLKVQGIHCHSGWGLQNQNLPAVGRVMARIADFAKVAGQRGVALEYLNLGGGLGTPLQSTDEKIDITAWATCVRDALEVGFKNGSTGNRCELPKIYLEPGDFVSRDCGVLVSKVLAVEKKSNINFAVLDASFAVNLQHAAYGLPMHAIALHGSGALDSTTTATESSLPYRPYRLVGAINEAVDVFNQEIELPELSPDDLIVFPNVGAYGASMSSQHCLRGKFSEVFLPTAQ